MGQCEIVDPAASWKLIFSIQPHERPRMRLNSLRRCLKIIDTFRGVVKRAEEWNPPSIRGYAGVDAEEPESRCGLEIDCL